MGNPTEIKYYDVDGFAFTEQRTYARGGQLTGFTIPTTAADVTVNTAGSYSYDTNNNMTGTKKLDAYRTISGTNYKIAFRAQWTFAFDRKNRLRTHTYPSGLNVRGNIWYDGMGRIWQRWNDDSVTGDWDADLKRFVYDGNALAQEHKFTAGGNGSWTYTYIRCEVDYLRKPDGIRQKVNNGAGGWDSHFLFNDGADVASRAPSGSSTTITRTLRTASGERLNDNPRMTPGLTTGSFNNISNLAKPNSYVESYGGGTELGTSSLGYDSLVQSGPVHQLPGLGGMILNSPRGFWGSTTRGAVAGNAFPVRSGGGPSGCGSCSGGNGRPMSMMGAWTAKADAAGFGDPWCYICVCPENTKNAGSYGCFTRAEFETLKPFPCLAGMFSCEGCVRCDGTTGGRAPSWGGDVGPITGGGPGTGEGGNGGGMGHFWGVTASGGAQVYGWPAAKQPVDEGCYTTAYSKSGIAECVEGVDDVLAKYNEYQTWEAFRDAAVGAIFHAWDFDNPYGGALTEFLEWLSGYLRRLLVKTDSIEELRRLLHNLCWLIGLEEFCVEYYKCVLEGMEEQDPVYEARLECCRALMAKLTPTGSGWQIPDPDSVVRSGLEDCGPAADIVIIIVGPDGGPPIAKPI